MHDGRQAQHEVRARHRPVVITDRGRPVAQIVPIRADETPYER
ncbi:MAG: type II toxin-antitoxin system prevent-host-death family antitoxin, partial [Actinomyces dentalis]